MFEMQYLFSVVQTEQQFPCDVDPEEPISSVTPQRTLTNLAHRFFVSNYAQEIIYAVNNERDSLVHHSVCG